MQTILLVEDSRFLRIATERILMKAGYAVINACDGPEALRMAADRHPDLIVLDMLLPKLSGPEVLLLLKKSAQTAEIPVIVCSGLSQKNEAKLCKAGACAFVEKSLLLNSPDHLLDIIKSVLQKQSPDEPVVAGGDPSLTGTSI